MTRNALRKSPAAFMSALLLLVAFATPAAAGERTRTGYYPNGVYHQIHVAAYDDYVSGYVYTGVNYTVGTIAIMQCSGTGNCSSQTVKASSRNYYTNYVSTGNPGALNHTFKTCGSVEFPNTSAYSNYCTELAANSWTNQT